MMEQTVPFETEVMNQPTVASTRLTDKMLRKLFKGYVVVETIFDIGFIAFLLFVLCMLVYYRQLYDNPFYLFIAVVVGIALLFGLYRTIRDLINLE
jgi:hypothetical protein